MADAKKVTTGKPKITGAIYRAALGTTLPTTASATLNAAFVDLGYAADDGLVNSRSITTDSIKAWGGDIVLTPTTEVKDEFKITLISALDENTLTAVYGADNVSGTLSSGITVKVNSKEVAGASWVFDMIMTDDALKRIVLPNATISEVGDVVYKDDEAVGYEVTLTALPDSDGNTHYEYITKASA